MKIGILAACRGAACETAQARSFGAVLRRLRAECPVIPFYPAQSAAEADAALARMARDGVTALRVLPVLLLRGELYRRLSDRAAAAGFADCAVAPPLLDTAADCRAVVRTVADAAMAAPGEALVLVGHGAAGDREAVASAAAALGLSHVIAGTLGAGPAAALAALRTGGWSRAVLAPLLLTAGVHARRDLAGPGPDSWRGCFARAGVPTRTVLRGLGEYEAVQALFAARLRALL